MSKSKPDCINILGQHFTIHYVHGNELMIQGDEEVNKVGEVAMGYCNAAANEIHVRDVDGCGEGAHRDTMLHEVLHAILAVTHLDQEMEDTEAEGLVSRITPVLLEVLRANRFWLAYIMEGESDPGAIH